MEEMKQTVVALAGNPNVGKSTVFNQLTGLRQHTGNWSGKTVLNASGRFVYKEHSYQLMDIPGCYSLMAHSQEEETARDFICFETPDIVVVVCDASCLERNLNLILQIMEVSKKVLVCVNLMDEAKKKGIHIDLKRLSQILNVPVVGTAARSCAGLTELAERIDELRTQKETEGSFICTPAYWEPYIKSILPKVSGCYPEFPFKEWLAARLLEGDESLLHSLDSYYPIQDNTNVYKELVQTIEHCRNLLYSTGITSDRLKDDCTGRYIVKAAEISAQVVLGHATGYSKKDRRLDAFFTSKGTGFLMMFLFLLFVFWITITGANYPSQLLNTVFGVGEKKLWSLLQGIHAPEMLSRMMVYGVYKVLAWVIAVMLPPMMIFFPLFTLLEDFGYLPRVAYNLDKCFHKCGTCGKQSLTMCMEIAYLLWLFYGDFNVLFCNSYPVYQGCERCTLFHEVTSIK